MPTQSSATPPPDAPASPPPDVPAFLPDSAPSSEDIAEGAKHGVEQAKRLAESIAELIRDLPWSTHTIIVGTLILGLLLWLFGRRSLKLAFAALGVWGGGVLGLMLPSLLAIPIPSWIAGLAGALLGLILALGAFRFTIAASLGLLAAIVAPIATAGLLQIRPLPPVGDPAPRPELSLNTPAPPNTPSTGTPARSLLPDGSAPAIPGLPGDFNFPGLPGGQKPTPSPNDPDPSSDDPEQGAEEDQTEGDDDTTPGEAELVIREGAGKARAFFTQLWDELAPHWNAQGERERLLITASGIAGLLLGVALGMILPKKSAGLVTAFIGAAMWLFAAMWLLNLAGWAGADWLPKTATAWTITWAITALIGTLFQWTGAIRSGAKKHSSKRDGKSG